jgi:hypothetical protein
MQFRQSISCWYITISVNVQYELPPHSCIVQLGDDGIPFLTRTPSALRRHSVSRPAVGEQHNMICLILALSPSSMEPDTHGATTASRSPSAVRLVARGRRTTMQFRQSISCWYITISVNVQYELPDDGIPFSVGSPSAVRLVARGRRTTMQSISCWYIKISVNVQY